MFSKIYLIKSLLHSTKTKTGLAPPDNIYELQREKFPPRIFLKSHFVPYLRDRQSLTSFLWYAKYF